MPAKVRQLGNEVHDKAQLPAKARTSCPALVNPLPRKLKLRGMIAAVFQILLLIENFYHRHSGNPPTLAKHPKQHCTANQNNNQCTQTSLCIAFALMK